MKETFFGSRYFLVLDFFLRLILASNYKSNIDAAFGLRFNNMVQFKKPSAEERLKLWELTKPDSMTVEDNLLKKIARNYELTGEQIRSAMAFSCLQALNRGTKDLLSVYVLKAIQLEL